jgi:uncharacterized delta-60 repeat protein
MVMRILPLLALLTPCLTAPLRAAGELDTSFNPDVNGEIKALALAPDGKIFIGGSFTSVGQVETNRIARLLSNGNPDLHWSNKAAGTVPSCAVLADGSVLMADTIASYQTSIYRLLPDGSRDQAAPIRTGEGQLYCMGVDSADNLLLGGDFNMIGSSECRGFGIVGMDGVIKSRPISSMGAGKAVFTLLPQLDRGTIVGGNFTLLDGKSRNHLVKIGLSGTLDSQFAPSLTTGTDTAVLCLAKVGVDGTFIAGGAFGQISVGSFSSRCLARFSAAGVRSSSFNPIFTHTTKVPRITALAVQADGRVIVAGDFTRVNDLSRNGLVRLHSDGSVDSSFTASAEGVTGLALQMDGKILITGNFLQVNGVPRNRIARLNNDTAADRMTILQSRVIWTPINAIPMCDQVTVEVSADGKPPWNAVGNARHVDDRSWAVSGINLPRTGVLRISGRTSSGLQNGSSGLVQKQVSYSLTPQEITVRERLAAGAVDLTDGQTTAVDYGDISQGSSPIKTLEIYNSGNYGLTLTGIQLPPGFTWLEPAALPRTITPQNYLTVLVKADAPALGAIGGTAVITTDDADEGSFEFPLAAVVTGPDIAAQLGSVDLPDDRTEPVTFATGYQGSPQVRETLVISNQGSKDLEVSSIVVSTGFTVDNPEPFSLHPGESRAIQVGPDQSVAGSLTGNLTLVSNDADEPLFRVRLAAKVVNPLVTKVMNTRTALDRKSGLRIQKLRITNPVKTATVAGFRVIVSGLPEWVQVRNASEILPDGSVVFVINRPLGPSGKFILPIEYEIPKGAPATVFPTLTTEIILNAPEAAVANALAVEKFERTREGHFAVTFRAVPGRLYQVEYSHDGKTWKPSTPTRAAGSVVRWLDCGWPHTECAPSEVRKRLYRVRELE